MVKLRSGKNVVNVLDNRSHESISSENMEKLTRFELDNILKQLEDIIKTIVNSLSAIKILFNNKMDKLQTRMNVIESRCALNENLIYLQGRKIDDSEQYSSKVSGY